MQKGVKLFSGGRGDSEHFNQCFHAAFPLILTFSLGEQRKADFMTAENGLNLPASCEAIAGNGGDGDVVGYSCLANSPLVGQILFMNGSIRRTVADGPLNLVTNLLREKP